MFIYFILFRIAALFNAKARKIVAGQKASLPRLAAEKPQGKYIWFHAASVGEFEQARPLIEKLKREQPGRKVLLTFFSCSGYELRKNYPQADLVLYLPFATRRNAKRFLNAIDIEMAIFVKYEFWPAYLKALRSRNIPTYSIDAIFRKNQAFFRWYGFSYRKLLKCFNLIFVQDEISRQLLEKYGIEKVVVAGDTRFDRVNEVCAHGREIPQLMRFIEKEITPLSMFRAQEEKIIVAGSTWPEDEKLLERYVRTHNNVKLVLVPHEINPEHLHTIFNLFQGRFVRFTEATLQNLSCCDTLLVDTIGMLSSIYRYADVAYIGGGFGEGIHNTIEPAVYGLPVIFGPNNKKFREAQELIRLGCGFSVKDYADFEAAMDRALLSSKELGDISKNYVQSELGATEKIFSAILKN